MTEIPALFALVVSLVILGSVWAWGFAFTKLFARQPLLAFEPRRQSRWSLLEIFVTVMLMFTLQGLAVSLLGTPDAPRGEAAPSGTVASQEVTSEELVRTGRINVLCGVASLIACGLGGLLIVARTGSSWGEDLGLTLRRAGRDVSYGVVAYVMLAPIIGLIQAVMQHWYPSQHPLIEKFRANPTLQFFLVCVFSAAIVAPLVEEFVCRVLFQGWLERVFSARSVRQAVLPMTELAEFSFSAQATTAANQDGPQSADFVAAGAGSPVNGPSQQMTGQLPSGMPIIISSLLFAVLHWGHGPDPVPLFVLALGLGYLYQRTHRILPCVVLHFLVNAFSLAVLAMSLASP